MARLTGNDKTWTLTDSSTTRHVTEIIGNRVTVNWNRIGYLVFYSQWTGDHTVYTNTNDAR